MSIKDCFNTLPPEMIEDLIWLVPDEMDGLDRATQAVVDEVFRNLEEAYRKSPAISQFMPPPSIARMMSRRTIVRLTADDIFKFHWRIHPSENLSPDHLHSILETRHSRLLMSLTHIDLQNAIRYYDRINNVLLTAAGRGDLPMVQRLDANGAIDTKNRGKALRAAVRNRHLPIVRTLLANSEGRLSFRHNWLILTEAINTGQLQMVQELSSRFILGNDERYYYMMSAWANDQRPIAAFLFAEGLRPCFGGAAVAFIVQTGLDYTDDR